MNPFSAFFSGSLRFRAKRTYWAVVPIALGSIWYFAFDRPASYAWQDLPTQTEGQQFRIILGLKDTQPRRWEGRVEVTGGEIAGLAGWRFSGQDRANRDGTFAFLTKMQPLEDQLREGSYYGQTGMEGQPGQRQVPEGLLLKIRGSASARVTVVSESSRLEFAAGDVAYGARLFLMEGNASVEKLPMERRISDPGAANDQPAATVTPEGSVWTAWVAYRDKWDIVMASDGNRVYSIGERGDLHAPAIAAGRGSEVYVAWPRNDNGTFHLFGSIWREGVWSRPERLTAEKGNDVWPRMAGDGTGNIALVWQGFRAGRSVILLKLWNGKTWTKEEIVSDGQGNCWMPTVAYGGGQFWMAWDSYATGAYQIYARRWKQPVRRVTRGDAFSVRPSLVVNSSGQPVAAWEESDPLWGKDFAYQVDKRGTVEYKNRRVRVAYLAGEEWLEIPASVEQAVPAEIRRYVQQPQLAMDAGGHLYLTFRSRTSTRVSRVDFWASQGRWETFVTHLDGDRWANAVLLPASVGRNGMRAAIVMAGGAAQIVWPTDNRGWPGGAYREIEIYTASLPITGSAARLSGGTALVAGTPAANPNPHETEDVRRIRNYRYSIAGKHYRILRGDFHRHTELSGDGAGDGMLEDNYRYTLDAAAMDIGYVSDHQMGQDEEYNWWITQKSNDLYYMPERFVPMYGYERSVPYPNGHRNLIWAERGQPVLKISPEENRGEINTGPVLYPYARKTGAVVTAHTSATQQGTDWRDNDPALEPVVEIYQGYDANYEEPNAPRAWKPGQTQAHQAQQPSGYVWNAWAKGYKLGVQSSSDHISTHTSYACVIAAEFTRQGILDAIRKRHTYAATDNIIMDFRIGTALMGDVIEAATSPKLSVKIVGTAPIAQVDVIKNNQYVHQLKPGQSEATFEYLDNAIQPGESYYYVRVQQSDGQLAWSSPIWVQYRTR
jgi:hypothetical protein